MPKSTSPVPEEEWNVAGPKMLVTGFGPFPKAPENPTQALVQALAGELPESLGASALRVVVLPTDYRRSWPVLRRLYGSFAPDLVVHFGLSRLADTLAIERTALRRVRQDRPDAAGFAPPSGVARRSGPESLASTLAVEAVVEALSQAGFPAQISDDAGGYVCNATLYRSLLAAQKAPERRVGFVHIPPAGTNGLTADRLREAAALILRAASEEWMRRA
jgi:pyroglutamyl-peptidase